MATVVFLAEEQRLLDDGTTEAECMALRVIFRYAHLGRDNNATAGSQQQQPSRVQPTVVSYLPITPAHIDECTYIGPSGLEFVRRLVQVAGVPTTLNSVSADRQR
jgi:hypothetical protein